MEGTICLQYNIDFYHKRLPEIGIKIIYYYMNTLAFTSDKPTCNRKAVSGSWSFPWKGHLVSTKAGLQHEHFPVPSTLTPSQEYFVLIRKPGSSSLKALCCFSQI